MREVHEPAKKNVWQSGWFWGVLGTILITAAPPLIWYWVGIDRDGRPRAAAPVQSPDKPPAEPAPADLLQPGSVWSGTQLIIIPEKERVLWDMRLVISKREGNAFFGEAQFHQGDLVFEVEGKIDQSAISWKNVKWIKGKTPPGETKPRDVAGTIRKDTIEAHRPLPASGGSLEIKLRLEKSG